jgi:hypothetical protein
MLLQPQAESARQAPRQQAQARPLLPKHLVAAALAPTPRQCLAARALCALEVHGKEWKKAKLLR